MRGKNEKITPKTDNILSVVNHANSMVSVSAKKMSATSMRQDSLVTVGEANARLGTNNRVSSSCLIRVSCFDASDQAHSYLKGR